MPTPSPQHVVLSGITFELLGVPIDNLGSAVAGDVRGRAALSGWNFRKTPVFVPAGTGPVRMQVPGEGSTALAWVPASAWNSGADLNAWAATSVDLQGCPDRDVTYLGGLLATDPTICLHLQARSAGSPEDQRSQRLDGAACSP